jgi:hypothetical protein
MKPKLLAPFAFALAIAAGACVRDLDAGGSPAGPVDDGDTLAVSEAVVPGTLDDLHRNVVLKSCAAQPGLCHSGQFEPNMSTPALFYANVVGHPGLEHDKEMRVAPGDPDHSLLVDKLLYRHVISRMPLGAAPLSKDDLALVEKWITGGALRRPGDKAATALNHPPAEPVVGVFDGAGKRLDGAGPIEIAPGDALVLRTTVEDFETPDDEMPFVGFELETDDGSFVLLDPSQGENGIVGYGAYDAHGPAGEGDVFDYAMPFSVTDTVTLVDSAGQMKEVPAAGLRLTVIAFYGDALPDHGGYATVGFVLDAMEVSE